MSEAKSLYSVLRQSADPDTVAAIEELVRDAPDRALCRVNVLDFAAKTGLDEERAIAAFLHAARLGLFELSWNVLCPSCGGVLEAGTTLKSVDREEYHCAWCAAGYQPILDEIVEVTFTVSRRVRRIAAHDPNELPLAEYFRQVFWGSGIDVPDDFEQLIEEIVLDTVELPPGEKALLSLQLPAEFVIVIDPVTHTTQFLDVKGEPTRERQNLSLLFDKVLSPTETVELRPGPLRLSLENRTDTRVLPGLWIAGDKLHELLGRRKPFLTAKRLLTNQVFRDIYGTDTIGDAVMATFSTPDRAVAAALRMREAMHRLNDGRNGNGHDLLLKIGIHEGPCLAVVLNDRQDYFGTTVNIAARVQGLADSRSILATGSVVKHPQASNLLATSGLTPVAQHRALRGIAEELAVYEIP